MYKILFTLLLLAIVAGCSNKQWYETGQNYQRNECIKHANNEAEYSQCLAAKQKSYKEYKKERDALVKK